MDEDKLIVFYDGDCGFCNHWVEWILKNDKNNKFRFSALQSDYGQAFLNQRGLQNKTLDTIYLWKPKSFYLKKSEAVLEIAKNLGGRYAWLTVFNIIPTALADLVYDNVAKRRHQLSQNKCYRPTEEERKKFIS